MRKNLREITPLNWTLVTEAIRRRKAEKLTEREHAALASVSIPTTVAFESCATQQPILRVIEFHRPGGTSIEVMRSSRSSATRLIDNSGWIPPPQVIRAFGAHGHIETLLKMPHGGPPRGHLAC